MKLYTEIIKEDIIHQTQALNDSNKVFDYLKENDIILLSRTGGEKLGFFKITGKYNSNRSIPGEDTMNIIMVNNYNEIKNDSNYSFPIVKEDPSYQYRKLNVINYACAIFEYNNKVLLVDEKGKGSGYSIIHDEIKRNGNVSLSDYILNILGITYNLPQENPKLLELIEDETLKKYYYYYIDLTKEDFERNFNHYKFKKNYINTNVISDAQFFNKEKLEEIIKNKYLRFIK